MKLADTLEKQIKERNERRKNEKAVSRDWSQNKVPNKNPATSSIQRTNKINETSKHNAMVALISPSAYINFPQRSCAECHHNCT